MKTLLIATQALVIGASAALAQSTAGTETPTPPPSKERAAGPQDGKGPQGDRRAGPGPHSQMMPQMIPGMMPQMMPQLTPGQMPGYAMMPGYVMVPMMVPVMPQMMPMMHPGMAPHGDMMGHPGKTCDKPHGKPERGAHGGAHGGKGKDGARWGEMRGRFLGEIMDDGQMTREEFDAKADEIFGRLDANGDGVISEDEMPGRRFGKGPRPDPRPGVEAPTETNPAVPSDN